VANLRSFTGAMSQFRGLELIVDRSVSGTTSTSEPSATLSVVSPSFLDDDAKKR
jgi:hypothetical protein